MKRLALLVLAAGALVFAAIRSQGEVPSTGELQIAVEDRNPWTNLKLNNDPAEFRFAIVSDRTGGHRARIFSQAVEQLNLLQPEFVLCVGDLIEGYTQKADRLAAEWKEFQSYVAKLQMPFFYLPGNHDVANVFEETTWKEKFGRRYYHFVYRNVLFLLLDSDDPPGKGGLGAEQQAYFQKVLDQNKGVRWTVVLLHRPLWIEPNAESNGWLEVEKSLLGRKYSVYCGHIHRYVKYIRNGMNYYQFATTGGSSKVRGVPYGEFDHIVWMTMKKEGPVMANLMMNGIYSEDMRIPITEEAGRLEVNLQPTVPVKGRLLVDGVPAPGAQVAFHGLHPVSKRAFRADGLVEADGTFPLSTFHAFDGAPVGEYKVTVTWRIPPLDANGKPGPSQLPAKYASPMTSGLIATVKEDGPNEFLFELKKEPEKEKEK